MNGLARLARLYSMLERVHAAEAQLAAASVAEVEHARTETQLGWQAEMHAGREALLQSDWAGWMSAECARDLVQLRIARLRELEAEREVLREAAMAVYRASRLRTEQLRRVVDRRETTNNLVEGRRAQAEADDRFGSRREWLRTEAMKSR